MKLRLKLGIPVMATTSCELTNISQEILLHQVKELIVRACSFPRAKASCLASHTLYDGKVGHIIASLFDHGTVSVAFPGTHRCFSTTSSLCSGTTTACGNGSEKFRITDVAHVMDYLISYNQSLYSVAHTFVDGLTLNVQTFQ